MPKLQPSDWKRSVPAGLKALVQWVGWGTADGRKVPKVLSSGRSAKANDPATWGSWDDACRWYERHQENPKRGVGFVFRKGDGLVFVDVDDCLTPERTLKEWAEPLVRPFVGRCYAEVSPGGSGLHLMLIGSFPPGAVKTGATWKVEKGRRDSVAVFDDRRFSTITGDVWEGCKHLEPNQELLDLLLARTGLGRRLTGAGEGSTPLEGEITDQTLADVKRALDAVDPDLPYDQWVKVGMGLRSLGDVGFKMWDEWSSRGRSYKAGETKVKWAGFKPEGVALGSVFFVAEEESGFTLRISAEDDFQSFKGKGLEDTPNERYERGSMAKWRELGLHLLARGKGPTLEVKPSEGDANVGLYFENHARWKGQLRWNERTTEIEDLSGDPLNLHELLRQVHFFMNWSRSPSEESVERTVAAVAKAQSYDPVREWLRELQWDGAKRIDSLLTLLEALEDTELTRRMFRRWMIGAVARAFRPGCRFQTMLVLHGEEGRKKSELFRRLASKGEWYSESKLEMSSKDGNVMLLGPWIVENAELEGMSRAEVSAVKVFISEAVSRFRKPYGRRAENHPRRCALAGTTNETEFLRGTSGNRRFWLIGVVPGKTLRVDLLDDALVGQLWAEAKQAFFAGERWWDEGAEVGEVMGANEEHYEGTALDGYVQAALSELEQRSVTTVQEVVLRLADKYRLPPGTRQRDVGSAMKRAGWVPLKLRIANEQRRFWRAPLSHDDFVERAAVQALGRISGSEFSAESTE